MTTLILYCLIMIHQIFLLWCQRQPECARVFLLGLMFIEICGYIALITIYTIIIQSIDNINLSLFRYVVKNQCSNGILQVAIEQYKDHFALDRAVVCTGLSFTVFSFAILLASLYKFYPVYKTFSRFLTYLKQKKQKYERRNTFRSNIS